jgi:TRAP-type C4-dicarboxylate transport system permease small subunit
LVYLLICAFLVVIIWNGIHISIINWRRILHNIPVSYSFVTMAAPVGALLMLLTTGSKIVFAAQLLYQLGKGQDKSKAEQNKSESTII